MRPTSQPLLWPLGGTTECARVWLKFLSLASLAWFRFMGGFPYIGFFLLYFSFPTFSSGFNTPWAVAYIVNKWIVLGRVFNKEFLCIYHCHNNEHSFFFPSPLDDLIPLTEELPALVGANELHVFSALPDLQQSIPRVSHSDSLHGTCIPFMTQHSPDSQHQTRSMEKDSGRPVK